jgi:regulator of sigma E protease
MHYLNILYGLLGLSFLVFIHELGHFLVARYFKMRVETFSIGFGPTLWAKTHKGVLYRLALIPFGGYVKVQGMDEESQEEGSYYKKRPYQRLLMVLAGPVINLIFAFLGFCFIYFCGGFYRTSVDSSKLIGMVDPASELYQKGVRPGDVLESINGNTVIGTKDLFFQAILNTPTSVVNGISVNYLAGTKSPFSVEIEPKKVNFRGVELNTIGLNGFASYLIFDSKRIKGPAMLTDSPMKESGIMDGDRLLWVNGELVFSREQLQNLLAEKKAFLTILRDHKILQLKVPKILLSDITLTSEEKEEINDLRFEAKIASGEDLEFIPYLIDHDGIVVSNFQKSEESILKPNDRILAVDGIKTVFGADVLQLLQKKHAVMITAHGSYSPLEQKGTDNQFFSEVKFNDLDRLISQIGVQSPGFEVGNLRLLKSVVPMEVEHQGNKFYRLGISLVDRQVRVNPNPFVQFKSCVGEISKLLGHLTHGELSPKHLSGPIGIVGAMQKGWSESFKDGVFWLSTISLNLGVMNLLPLPVLDGGHIVFNLYEMLFRRRVDRKVMERIFVPFVFLLIGFAIFVTFHDIMKIFGMLKF